ncbi:MAG: succinylglutamate desuccinylase/aspartoacylase family protein [Cryomorphaceae bacterium]|nr:succinylglutamate desuccinylase/aspartoacylase family protein [Cryomorphaceae bacterium]
MSGMIIDGRNILPGETRFIEIDVARLPSGTLIHMPIHVFRSKNPGPCVLFSGGLHGDEVNGVEIVRRIIDSSWINNLQCGTIIALPIINVHGFNQFSRDVPDGKDVNRSFPGSADGSLAAIVADLLTTKILPHVDFGIDFHTGGASRTNYPQTRFAPKDERAAEIANDFAAPYTLHSGLISGSLRSTASDLGVPIVVYEGGESLRFDPFAIKEGVKGVKRVLHKQGMIQVKPPKVKKQLLLKKSVWVRADASGLFVPERVSGKKVTEGQIIGKIDNPYNQFSQHVVSPKDGYIIGHNNMPLVHRGDALFHIAEL